MSAVDDVRTYLIAQGEAGGSSGWVILRRRFTDEVQDRLIVVSDDGGPQPEIKETAGLGDAAQGDIGVLVAVRAGAWDGDASALKANDIRAALHGLRSTLLGATTYLRVVAMTTEAVFIGFDDSTRPTHTIAFRLLKAL